LIVTRWSQAAQQVPIPHRPAVNALTGPDLEGTAVSFDAVSSEASPVTVARPIPDVAAAIEHVRSAALIAGPVGTVGIELEQHVIDLARRDRRPDQDRVAEGTAGDLPCGSRVSFEPGGQVELSGPPQPDVLAAVVAMRTDLEVLTSRLASLGLVGVPAGTDGHRNPVRVNDTPRYSAMADHFLGAGFSGPASVMMCSTAALQINLEAGPEEGWAERVDLAVSLGPILVALAASSPELLGRRTGWVSTRMRTWAELDRERTSPMRFGDDPALSWAKWAVSRSVMMQRDPVDGTCSAVRKGVPFAAWVTGDVLLGGRRPTWADLDYHLTTLWPPLRMRGSLEVRAPDSCPWWPAVTAVAVACMDDPAASAAARAACTPVADGWRLAAKHGLADPTVAEAALGCVHATLDALPRLRADGLLDEVHALEERVRSGGT
jgi:ergothioneine biosynthesis glutamate--cysteine ligase EgtA